MSADRNCDVCGYTMQLGHACLVWEDENDPTPTYMCIECHEEKYPEE